MNDRERVLYDILGVVSVTDELRGEQRCRANVSTHEHAERRAVASGRGGEELGV